MNIHLIAGFSAFVRGMASENGILTSDVAHALIEKGIRAELEKRQLPQDKIDTLIDKMACDGVCELFPVEKGWVGDNYEDGLCPDCSNPIPATAIEGEECFNCDHVFYNIHPNDDQPSERRDFSKSPCDFLRD